MTKKAPPRKPPVKKAPAKKSASICGALSGVTSDTLAEDIKDIAYSISSADSPTSPILDSENGNWDDFVDTFTAPRDPFDPDRDYGYTDRNGERRTSAVPVSAKNYYGYIVPRCKGNRNNKALSKQQHIALDYDKLPIGTLHDVMQVLTDAGAAHVVYTTASHLTKKKDGLECFRVVVPMDEAATTIRNMVAVRVALADVLARQLPGLVVDRASFTPSQPMFLPVAGSQVWHASGRSQSVARLLAHFDAAGLSVHVPKAKEGGARVPEGIDQIFEPVMDLLVEWGATARDDSGRMLMQCNDDHAENYSTESKPDDFAFMFPMDGIAEVFNVSAIHGSDLDELDQWKRRNPKKKGESVGAYTERRRLAGIQYAIDACAPDTKARNKMTVLMTKTIEAHKGTLIQSADEGDLSFDDEPGGTLPKSKAQKEAQAIANAVQDLAGIGDKSDDEYDADVQILQLIDNEEPAMNIAAEWLKSSVSCGCQLAFDEFSDGAVFKLRTPTPSWLDHVSTPAKADPSGWQPVTDKLTRALWLTFCQLYPDYNIADSVFYKVIDAIADQRPFDSMREWLDERPAHDGKSRAAEFFPRVFGVDDNEYSRACGLLLWSALAGRQYVPGIQMDNAIVLVGEQGIRKTTTIGALVPFKGWTGKLDFNKKGDERVRLMLGKAVMEIDELSGFSASKLDEVKSFMTTQNDEMRDLYARRTHQTERRTVFLGSSNNKHFLRDTTGERRWLPMEATKGDRQYVIDNLDQLWAEGCALFKQNGIMWQDANRYAEAIHGDFKEVDAMDERIGEYLKEQQDADMWRGFVTISELADALNISVAQCDKRMQMRIAACLRARQYNGKQRAVNGVRVVCWSKE